MAVMLLSSKFDGNVLIKSVDIGDMETGLFDSRKIRLESTVERCYIMVIFHRDYLRTPFFL